MTLTDLLKDAYRTVQKAARPALLGLALAYCGPTEDDSDGCRTDYDCREPRVCVRGYCEGGNGGDNNPAGERFCEQYNDICPGSLSWADECEKYCVPERTFDPDYKEFSDDCLFVYCLNEAQYCIDRSNPDTRQGENDPDVLKCMESYGWAQCEKDSHCALEEGEKCNNNRCSKS